MDNSGFSFATFCGTVDEELADSTYRRSCPVPLGRARAPELPSELVKLAKRIKAIRDSRNELLDASLFGEPAWNILLALYVAAGEQYLLSISALCAESGSPATTAARSINRLLELGMARRVPNPSDNRSAYIELTGDAAAKLTQLLDSARNKYLAD